MPINVPSNAQWAIRWEVFAPGADGDAAPTQPQAPDPLPEGATQEEIDAKTAEIAAYTQRMSDYQAEIEGLLADDSNWQLAYSPQPDEASARNEIILLNEVYGSNNQARNFTLVYSAPVEWVEVPT